MASRHLLRTFALFAVLVAAAGCAEDDPETAVGAFEDEETVELVTGEPFEATATVTGIVSERAFYLLDTLVITAEPVDVSEDDLVLVNGEVTEADVEKVEALAGSGLDDEAKAAVDDEDLVVVATRVEQSDD